MSEPYQIAFVFPRGLPRESGVHRCHRLLHEHEIRLAEDSLLYLNDTDTEEPEPEPVTDEDSTLRKLVHWPTLGSLDYAGPEGLVTVSFSDSREQGPVSCITISALGRAVDRTNSLPRYRQLGTDLHQQLAATRTVMDWGLEMRGFSCAEEVDRLRSGRFEGTYSLLDLRNE
ncbi:hypothetical protein Q5425_41635 [Amycolatopsis sp. A133]|uniref:hypothetical protein n=1 Tax=Amycolatopsis sp. A133 TaxID=3064472 RepID=UPI0027F41016|nr:hypothetical protein [Amycolatopsis sp. A133]MDQ7810266.1 hypothetical protein [Amycolatopsis sp. A133]